MKPLLLAVACLLTVATTGCNNAESMLKEQSDLVCACTSFECAMGVLKGPINQKLKKMKGSITPEGRKQKVRMMKCIMDLKLKGKGK